MAIDCAVLSRETVMSFRELVKIVNERGACVTAEKADAWFRELPRGPGAREIQRRQAQQACAGCPVRTECLSVALTHEIESEMSWGIWGGVCARDRQETIEKAQRDDPRGIPHVDDLLEQLYPLAHPDDLEVTSAGQSVPMTGTDGSRSEESASHSDEYLAS